MLKICCIHRTIREAKELSIDLFDLTVIQNISAYFPRLLVGSIARISPQHGHEVICAGCPLSERENLLRLYSGSNIPSAFKISYLGVPCTGNLFGVRLPIHTPSENLDFPHRLLFSFIH